MKTVSCRKPGTGTTLAELLIAEGLACGSRRRIAFIDTERNEDFYAVEIPDRSGRTQSSNKNQEQRRNNGRI